MYFYDFIVICLLTVKVATHVYVAVGEVIVF